MREDIWKILERQDQQERRKLEEYPARAIRGEFQEYPSVLHGVLCPLQEYLDCYQKNWQHQLHFTLHPPAIRVAAEPSVNKHTDNQVPYYHSHSFYEFIYVYQGKCSQYLYEGKEEKVLHTGGLCLLTPGAVHAMLPCTRKDCILKLDVPVPLMDEALEAAQLDREERRVFDQPGQVLIFYNGEDPAFLQNVILRMLVEYDGMRPHWKQAFQSLLQMLIISLTRQKRENFEGSLLQSISNYIRREVQNATLEELAGEMGYSPRHLGRRIKEKTGSSFTDILRWVRMEIALALLVETNLSVEEIATQAGYQSISGFYKTFRAMFGLTPNIYRKRFGL